jgi:flavin reductase (DIM6/NTAB) family NADH-FMN oxidoreductase RutF
MDAREFRNALGRFATGVTVVTVPNGEGVRGITANAFMSVSLHPPLVVVSIDKKARTHELLLQAERYGVSILREDQEALSNHFAGLEGETEPVLSAFAGLLVVEGALAHLVCRTVDRHAAGDHTLFIGEVEALRYREGRPLLYFRGKYGHFRHPEEAPKLTV